MLSYLLSAFKLNHRILRFLFAWSTIGLIYLGIGNVLTNLYVVKLGFDLSFLGVINGSRQIIWAVAALPAGWIGVRLGLRNSLIVGFCLVSISMACFLSIAWLPRPVWAAGLLLSNSFTGIGSALLAVNSIPYLMAIAQEKDRNLAFTVMTALIAFTSFIGSLAAGILPGFLLNLFPIRLNETSAINAVLWLAIPAYLGSALLLLKTNPEPLGALETKSVTRDAAPLGTLIFLGILFGLQIGSESALGMFLNVYFSQDLDISNSSIGIIFAVARLVPFFLLPLLPHLLNRWGSGLTMITSYLLIAGCAFLLAFIPVAHIAAAGFILFSIVASFAGTARNLFGQESVLPRWRTAVSAVLTISMAAGGGLVGFGAGRLINTAGFRGAFLSSAIMSLLVVLLYGTRYWLRIKQAILIQPQPYHK